MCAHGLCVTAPASLLSVAPLGSFRQLASLINAPLTVREPRYFCGSWFISTCWPILRRNAPTLRLRLIGEPPQHLEDKQRGGEGKSRGAADDAMRATTLSQAEKSNKTQTQSVSGSAWTYGTPFYGSEFENGIDVLSFLPDDQMHRELQTW